MYAHLLSTKSLSVSIFKVVDFIGLSSARTMLFLRIVFLNTLQRIKQDNDLREIFDPRKWQSKKKQQSFELDSNISALADGLDLFCRKFLFTDLNAHIVDMEALPEIRRKCKLMQQTLKNRGTIF